MTPQLADPLMPAVPATNGQEAQSHLPAAPARKRWSKLWWIGGAAVLVVVAVVAIGAARVVRPVRVDLVTHIVRYDRLELSVVERGALESADNHDIYCRVKSGAKNSTVATTIKSVIDDGSQVLKDRPKNDCGTIITWDKAHASWVEKAGDPNKRRVMEVHDEESNSIRFADVIVELDDSGLQEQLKTQKINLDTAESNKIQAEEQYKITVSQNEADIKNAETALELAKIDLQKYREGDYPQALKDVEGRIKVAESDLDQQRERAAWSQRMVKKGYQTVSQAQAEESKQESLEIALRKVLEEKRVLTDPIFGLKKRTETDLANKVSVAEKALLNTKSQALAKEVKDRTDRDTKRSLWEQAKTQYEEIVDEIKKCKICTPQDGMVVYFIPEQARFGGGSQQSIVAQGEPVREGQKLMQIPDLGHMLVNTKVHEALVSKVHKDQPARVRVDAYPDRAYVGSVDSVATISSQQDWMSADVKVYTTKVAIDEIVQGLKPGMSAEVTITVGDALEQVLTIPVEAVVGSVEMGGKRRCFVMGADGPEPRDIVVGLSNDRMVEVREGLKEGEQVVLNPKKLLSDDEKPRRRGSDASKSSGAARGTGPARDKAVRPQPNGGGPATGRPDGGPGGAARPAGGQGGNFANMSPEERQKQWQTLKDSITKAKTPDEKKQILERIPEEARGFVKERLKSEGVDVP